MKQIILIVIAFIGLQTVAQTTGKIVDAQSGEPIPYANIQCNSDTLISNADGFFPSHAANRADDASLSFSYVGYSTLQMAVGDLKSRQNTARLPAGIFELDEVKVRERPPPEAIIAAVRQNLKQNYSSATANFQTKIFMRKSNAFTPKTLNIEIDKSTGFTKNNLKGFNKELAGFTSQII